MKKISLAGALRMVALLLLVGFVWCVVRDRTTAENWRVPLDYRGDAPQILGWIKAASEGDYIPFWGETVSRLGAPYTADWNDYPMYEKILTFTLGMVAKVIGIFPTSNFGILLGHLLSAASFYLCSRFLKNSKTWSFVGAVLFSFAYYHFLRNLGHLLLAFSYTLPWALLSCWIIAASKRLRIGDKLFWVCVISSLVMGLSNPYHLNMYVQLLSFSLLVQYVRKRRAENLKVGLMCLAIAGVAFIAINMGTLAFEWAHGKNPSALDRHYYESEIYALKPMEFVLPPATHNIPALADITNYYVANAYVHGETSSAYLGVVGIAGLIWIFWEAFLLIARNRQRNRNHIFPPHAVQSTWIIFYSIIGGLNCLIALAGVQLFRAADRYSIFISTIILLFLVRAHDHLDPQLVGRTQLHPGGAILLIGIVDQTPKPLAASETLANGRIIDSDVKFGQAMEQALPAKTMVFQMPVMTFPEAVPIGEVSGYEMLRPYFVTKTLRFSFGSVRGRNREAWQWEAEKLPPAEMIRLLESFGFGAIYLNRKGYKDHGEQLIRDFAAAGRSVVAQDDLNEQVLVKLNPSPVPELPHTDLRAQILFKSGWSQKEHTPLANREWSSGNATLTFFSEPRQTAHYSLQCGIGSLVPRHVRILLGDREVWSGSVDANQGVPVDITVTGHHGNNKNRIADR